MFNTKKFSNAIRKISKRYSGVESNMLYLTNTKSVTIGKYVSCTPDTAQATQNDTRISFDMPDRKRITFCSDITETVVDRKAYDNYGGILQIKEPLTDEISGILLKLRILSID
jgi:hypothetical protein